MCYEFECEQQRLTDLQLPGDSSFTLFSEVHLSLVVFCHHLHKLLGQDGVLVNTGVETTCHQTSNVRGQSLKIID